MTNLTKEQIEVLPKQAEFTLEEKNEAINLHLPLRYQKCDIALVDSNVVNQIKGALEEGKGIFLTGTAGTGKTFILYSLLRDLMLNNIFYQDFDNPFLNRKLYSSLRYNFIEMPVFSMKLKSYVSREEDPTETIKKYTNPQFLFIDDLGAEKMTEFLFESFYVLLNERYKNEKMCFISSNYSLKEISEKINDRIASRIAEMCVVIKLNGNDKRIK